MLTITAIKADISSIGGHTEPSAELLEVARDSACLKAQRKAEELRRQGFVGPAMLPIQELEYGTFRDSLGDLESQFSIRERAVAGSTDHG